MVMGKNITWGEREEKSFLSNINDVRKKIEILILVWWGRKSICREHKHIAA